MSTNGAKRFVGGFALFAACALLSLAIQNLPARLLALPVDDLRDTVMDNPASNEENFEAFVKAREAAVEWHKTADYLDELAAAYSTRATREDISAIDADRFFQKSIADQSAALKIEPADTYGWSQMSFLQTQNSDDAQKAADFLRLSIETAPYEPSLMPSRLDTMIGLRAFLTPDEVKQIPFVAREAWQIDPQGVAAAAQDHNYISVMENALGDDPQALDKFHALARPSADDDADSAGPLPVDPAAPAGAKNDSGKADQDLDLPDGDEPDDKPAAKTRP